MVNRSDGHIRGRLTYTGFSQDPAEKLLEQLAKKPGNNLVEKAVALNSEAREALTPILAKLDALNSEANPALMGELNAAIEQLDRVHRDGIEDEHYGEMQKFADSRYDEAPIED